MTNRIDHATEARRLIELASIQPDVDSASAVAQAAQAHAQLALVEQQRIANLIALAHGETHVSDNAYLALIEGLYPEGATLRPDIAAALGIEVAS